MKLNGFTEESIEEGNFALLLGLSYFLAVVLSFGLSGIVNHQPSVMQMMIPDVLEKGSEAHIMFQEIMDKYGDAHRSFKHGAIHGLIITVLFVFPIMAINALFEKRGWAYIRIHSLYWLICLCLVGGILCQHFEYPINIKKHLSTDIDKCFNYLFNYSSNVPVSIRTTTS
jgi:hypothetical protein